MSVMNGLLDFDEKEKLDSMFEGDSKRDASDKIRGFIFQDLAAIDLLLDDDTKYVCVEYLEDIDVFCNDGTVKIIQVKYYPKSSPTIKEIMTDLYYQYLRMELLESKLLPKPQLLIHINKTVRKPGLNRMKTYIGSLKKTIPQKMSDLPKWLSENVYQYEKKEKQKNTLFDSVAYEASVINFLNAFNIVKKNDIKTYRDEVGEKLTNKFSDCLEYDNEEYGKSILLGLAILYIQKRYTLENAKFEQIKVDRAKFFTYIKQTMQTKTKDHMIAYVISCIWEFYMSIVIEDPDLDEDYVGLLNQIVINTQEWISEILSTEEGQLQLLNTISKDSNEAIKSYSVLRMPQKVFKIIECRDNLRNFLFYLWKIMINLCKRKSDFCVDKNADMLNPQTYVVKEEKKYLCIKFPMDCVKTSVILPPIQKGQANREYENISTRMYLAKPQKWYIEGSISGKKDYKYPVSEIIEEGSVVGIGQDGFIVECMDCIGIDQRNWKNIEKCEECIFASSCVKGKWS